MIDYGAPNRLTGVWPPGVWESLMLEQACQGRYCVKSGENRFHFPTCSRVGTPNTFIFNTFSCIAQLRIAQLRIAQLRSAQLHSAQLHSAQLLMLLFATRGF